ncbi:lamin tail domain-containing protein [Reichenbachiella sp.]|uniref:lamin tail domain-containing protein n=2 Tax=Reichenbachiella sp. TaxID=2184521 RepID=UPI003297590D
MNRFLLALILCASILSVRAQEVASGDFLAYIESRLAALPGKDANDFSEPTTTQSNLWAQAMIELINGQYALSHATLSKLNYRLVKYTDNVSGSVYYMAEKLSGSTNHWGIYVLNTAPLRPNLILQAPHPKFDSKTGSQAAYVFRETHARALTLSGTHRCNSGISSSCSGTTEACSSGTPNAYRISDNAHNIKSPFQSTTELLLHAISNSIFVQLHGFFKTSSDPHVIMSNGTSLAPTGTDYLLQLRDALYSQDSDLTFKIAHLDNWTKLTGTTNVQGRLINAATNPCLDASPGNNGRFIHLEQEKSRLRSDVSGWTKVSNAIASVFPTALVINEIHADPASGASGDANGDGIRDSSEDEFIELVNTAAVPIDLSGFKIYDSNSQFLQRHVFPTGTILSPGKAIVIFGGGSPNGSFGNSLIQTASTGTLGITNSNETLVIHNAYGQSIMSYNYGSEGNNNQSITRSPDGSNTIMSQHSSASGSGGALFSPGTRVNGSVFSSIHSPFLLINEIHADPASDISGDANGDGIRNSSHDEFIEIVNIGSDAADLAGYQVYDANSQYQLRHVFPTGSTLAPGQAVVLFGGGTPAGTFGNSLVQTASTGALGITNTSEIIEVRDAAGNLVATHISGSEANDNQSVTRSSDWLGTAPLVKHSSTTHSSGSLYSPGAQVNGSDFGAPIAAFSTDLTDIAAGQSVSFTDLSIAHPYQWHWSFAGGTPATSSQPNPTVTYHTAGTYSVSLTATNAAGNDIASRTSLITVITTCSELDDEDFESSWGIWNDGGNDSYRSNEHAIFANSGSYSIRLRDNTSESVMTTDDLNLLSYSSIEVSFSYMANSMDNSSEDFWLQVSTDGGSSFSTVEEWNYTDEFVNNQRYHETIEVSNIAFTSNTQLRFRCDASSNHDQVYIDDIEIKVCGSSGARTLSTATKEVAPDEEENDVQNIKPETVFPNPASQSVTIDLTTRMGQKTDIHVMNLQGKRVLSHHLAEVSEQRLVLNLQDLRNGVYLIQIDSEDKPNSLTKLIINK